MNAFRRSLILAAASVAGGLALAAPAQSQQKVVIGFDGSYPPYASIDTNGELKGFDVDIVKGVCAAEKLECELKSLPWEGIFTALDAKKIDVVATVAITDERKKRAAFTNAYLKSPWAYMALASSPIEATGDALNGKTVGTVAASSPEKYLNTEMANKVTVSGYDSMDAAVLDLDSGRVDAVVGEFLQLQSSYVKAKPNAYKIVGEPFYNKTFGGQGQGLALRLDDKSLLETLNKGLAAMESDGTTKELTKKWFDVEVPAN